MGVFESRSLLPGIGTCIVHFFLLVSCPWTESIGAKCPDGFWGVNCTTLCPTACALIGQCDQVNGTCNDKPGGGLPNWNDIIGMHIVVLLILFLILTSLMFTIFFYLRCRRCLFPAKAEKKEANAPILLYEPPEMKETTDDARGNDVIGSPFMKSPDMGGPDNEGRDVDSQVDDVSQYNGLSEAPDNESDIQSSVASRRSFRESYGSLVE